MGIEIEQVGPCFAGEVAGLDLRKPLSDSDAEMIHAGMDEYAVLIFHGPVLTAEQQLALSRKLGELEHSHGTSLRTESDQRLPPVFADVSNLDRNNRQTMHRVRPYPVDEKRDMRRTTLAGDGPTAEQWAA